VDYRAAIEDAVRVGFNNYQNFTGRAARMQFWMWVVFQIGVGIIAAIIDSVVGTGFLIGLLAWLVLVVPGLAFGARRMHDIGKSGWYQAAALVPLIGAIYVIYLFAQPGVMETNEWGPAPMSGVPA
jgi:uncharacterized membrane protein YhaH (DUF805 family)